MSDEDYWGVLLVVALVGFTVGGFLGVIFVS
jgi:hypothetical protein